jgi:hypothetical protein
MLRRSIFVLGVCGVLGWLGGMNGNAVFAATCDAAGRFVGGKPVDAKGFKQAVTVAVAPKCGGPCHGLVTYTVQWKDKSGATQSSTGKTVKYAFLPGQGSAGAGSGGGSNVVDSTVLEAGACADATPCRVTGAAVNEVSCFKDGGGRCATTASYSGASATDTKGFKQDVGFVVSSDAGSAAHGLVKYTLQWTDKTGSAKTSSKSVPYKGSSGGGGGGNEIQVVDDTVLGAGADGSPCSVIGGAIEKVSCFLDK